MNDNKTPQYYGGAIAPTRAQLEAMPRIQSLSRAAALPSSVDLSLSGNFPRPGNQGSQNSCVGWAIAYAIRTYQEQVERSWGIGQAVHQFSPAFIYNQREGGQATADKGMMIDDAFDIITQQGVCSLASMPYNVRDSFTKPTANQKTEAAKYKSLSVSWIEDNNLQIIKQLLAKKIPVFILVPIYQELKNLSRSKPLYDQTRGPYLNDNHAVCVVGYDDAYPGNGAMGALKFMNSWGTSWGVDGYGYISYRFMAEKNDMIWAFSIDDKIDLKSLSLNKSDLNLPIGERERLYPQFTPENTTSRGVNYSSVHNRIASISFTGEITAQSIGETTIYARTTDPDSSAEASCRVKVVDARLTLNKNQAELYVGENMTLTKTVTPANSVTNQVTWSSSNPAVAVISSTGNVRAISPGEAVITVKCNYSGSNAAAACRLKVLDAKISLNKRQAELYVGDRMTLTKTITPNNSITNKVIWSSSNPAVATINSSTGTVQAQAPGEAVISVKCNYPGSQAIATCQVIVKTPDDSIFLSDTIPNKITAGKTCHVTVTLKNSGIRTWLTTRTGNLINYSIGTDVNGSTTGALFLEGSNRIQLPKEKDINPGALCLVSFQIKVPLSIGTYHLKFQLLNEKKEWFGSILEKTIVVSDPDEPILNSYGSVGTFKHNQLTGYNHYRITTEKFKNYHIDWSNLKYQQMITYSQNQLREGEI